MSVSELNKLKVRQFFEQVLNQGRLDLIDDLVANDFIGRVSGQTASLHGPDAVRRFVSQRRRSWPELYVQIEDQIAEEDRVVTRWRAIAWSPQAIVSSPMCAGITIVRLLAGKQVDAHTQYTGAGASAQRGRVIRNRG